MENSYSDDRMIAEALDRVERGSSLSVDGLTMTPLLDGRAGEARYQTLQEAIAGGGFAVEEVSESGQVSELRVRNKGSQPVFLLDGEEVLGAKQNRVVNLSIMVPPQSATVIPVACVERGRWSRVSDEFRSSPNSLPSRDRAAKMRDVSGAMRRGAPPVRTRRVCGVTLNRGHNASASTQPRTRWTTSLRSGMTNSSGSRRSTHPLSIKWARYSHCMDGHAGSSSSMRPRPGRTSCHDSCEAGRSMRLMRR